VRTTSPSRRCEGAGLLKLVFTAEQPNTKYVGDITYLPLADGNNLYLAIVMDCCCNLTAGRSPDTYENQMTATNAEAASSHTRPAQQPGRNPLSAVVVVVTRGGDDGGGGHLRS
jgi:transposase InsO family protein